LWERKKYINLSLIHIFPTSIYVDQGEKRVFLSAIYMNGGGKRVGEGGNRYFFERNRYFFGRFTRRKLRFLLVLARSDGARAGKNVVRCRGESTGERKQA